MSVNLVDRALRLHLTLDTDLRIEALRSFPQVISIGQLHS